MNLTRTFLVFSPNILHHRIEPCQDWYLSVYKLLTLAHQQISHCSRKTLWSLLNCPINSENFAHLLCFLLNLTLLQGDRGTDGKDGNDGDKGENGEKGQKGQPGQVVTGPKGIDGVDGKKGDRGPKGDEGPKGVKGVAKIFL